MVINKKGRKKEFWSQKRFHRLIGLFVDIQRSKEISISTHPLYSTLKVLVSKRTPVYRPYVDKTERRGKKDDGP